MCPAPPGRPDLQVAVRLGCVARKPSSWSRRDAKPGTYPAEHDDIGGVAKHLPHGRHEMGMVAEENHLCRCGELGERLDTGPGAHIVVIDEQVVGDERQRAPD